MDVAFDRPLDCLCGPQADALPLHAVASACLADWLATLPAPQGAFLRASGFTGARGTCALLPGESGVVGAVLGLGRARPGAGLPPGLFGAAPGLLPRGSVWRLGDGVTDASGAVLGFCLGAYRYTAFRHEAGCAGPRLVVPGGLDAPQMRHSLSAARATWLVRDLVNTPANRLGPQELALAARQVLTRDGGDQRVHINVITGEAFRESYPAVAAVAEGSTRPGAVVVMRWHGSAAAKDAPLISICGKGVCFDTGGYDLKPADGMLRMKKDMAGAAVALALARMVMDADLPLRLELRLACVENAVSGNAMRPLDVLQTRKGLTVEVGNTDAEGRLVLCDLLAEASEQSPCMIIDFATLTGAARMALGPDIAALFCNSDALCSMFEQAAIDEHDPVWRLPLWDGYNSWLDSSVADVNNVSGKAYAGAVTAALFLRRFVGSGIGWAHFDIYGWNDQATAGRPAGGEAQVLRAAYTAISRIVHDSQMMFLHDITPIEETLELSLR